MRLSEIIKIPVKIIETILVIAYIVFEEIIWNTFAKPIFEYLKSLAILEALKQTFLNMNRYLLVSIFILILVLTEYMGVLALITIAQQQVVLGVFIYALKIPIATFTFWLFELTKPQLMTFVWLKVSYEAVMKLIDLLVSSSIYQTIKINVKAFKQNLRRLSERYLHNNVLFKLLKSWYALLKTKILKKNQNLQA